MIKLTRTQEAVVALLRDGYTVVESRYMGSFGTAPAHASKFDGGQWSHIRLRQGTLDALRGRGVVRTRYEAGRSVVRLVDKEAAE